jgi:hypothetical protein
MVDWEREAADDEEDTAADSEVVLTAPVLPVLLLVLLVSVSYRLCISVVDISSSSVTYNSFTTADSSIALVPVSKMGCLFSVPMRMRAHLAACRTASAPGERGMV